MGNMSKPARGILEVLFPQVRAKLLRLFFTNPSTQRYVRELTNMSGLALHTVQDELRKLRAVGLITSWSNGYHRFYRANRDHPLYSQILRIVQLNEKLPRTKHSTLHRLKSRPAKRERTKPHVPPTDRPVSWHLFSQRKQTRRL